MKHSIKIRITCTLMIMTMLTIFLCWFANKTMLADYYTHSKIQTLGQSYKSINESLKKTEQGEEKDTSDAEEKQQLEWERLESNKNMSLYIFQMVEINFHGYTKIIPSNFHYPKVNESNLNIIDLISEGISKYFNSTDNKKEMKLIDSQGDQYSIYRVFDKRINSYYIELIGTLDNDYTVYMRANYENIRESVNIANKFLMYVGLFVTLISSIVMMFISNSITKPILDLADIAKQMSNLNFNVKYTVKRQDEIGVLGNSVNMLSEKLERTISELKTANNELMSDIQNKIQIDETRKEFLSNVSHELKTPIALIQGYAEGLIENINDDEENRNFYCEVIMDEANKMNKMVKKLLSLNQLESGDDTVHFEHFDLIAVIKAVLSSTEILFQQKEAELDFNYTGEVYVWADEYMVEEVVTNYISNALNHVDGGKKIKVWLERKQGLVRISVFNTGSTIPDEDLDKIWVKFYKVDKARTREYGGSGIGLSIVKAIMTSLNQECGVINHEDGVEFWFELDCNND